MTERMHPDDLADLAELIADRLAQRLAAGVHTPAGLVDATTLAAALGVARSWVYEHADELGAVRLGTGRRARLRFDLEAASAAMSCSGGGDSLQADEPMAAEDATASQPGRSGRRAARVPEPGGVLAVRGAGDLVGEGARAS